MSIDQHYFSIESHYKPKKGKNPFNALIDEIDVDSYFLHNFLGLFVVQNSIRRLNKDFFRETKSINKVDAYILKQIYFSCILCT